MAEFWFLFICNMLVPVTMLVLGYLFKGIHFPKDVNALCGYRTSMSMKNEKTWKFANAYWGKICWRIGWGVALVTAFATILSYLAGEEIFNTTSIVLCMGQCFVETDSSLLRRLRNAIDCCKTNSSLRNIDDPPHCKIVFSIINRF